MSKHKKISINDDDYILIRESEIALINAENH